MENSNVQGLLISTIFKKITYQRLQTIFSSPSWMDGLYVYIIIFLILFNTVICIYCIIIISARSSHVQLAWAYSTAFLLSYFVGLRFVENLWRCWLLPCLIFDEVAKFRNIIENVQNHRLNSYNELNACSYFFISHYVSRSLRNRRNYFAFFDLCDLILSYRTLSPPIAFVSKFSPLASSGTFTIFGAIKHLIRSYYAKLSLRAQNTILSYFSIALSLSLTLLWPTNSSFVVQITNKWTEFAIFLAMPLILVCFLMVLVGGMCLGMMEFQKANTANQPVQHNDIILEINSKNSTLPLETSNMQNLCINSLLMSRSISLNHPTTLPCVFHDANNGIYGMEWKEGDGNAEFGESDIVEISSKGMDDVVQSEYFASENSSVDIALHHIGL